MHTHYTLLSLSPSRSRLLSLLSRTPHPRFSHHHHSLSPFLFIYVHTFSLSLSLYLSPPRPFFRINYISLFPTRSIPATLSPLSSSFIHISSSSFADSIRLHQFFLSVPSLSIIGIDPAIPLYSHDPPAPPSLSISPHRRRRRRRAVALPSSTPLHSTPLHSTTLSRFFEKSRAPCQPVSTRHTATRPAYRRVYRQPPPPSPTLQRGRLPKAFLPLSRYPFWKATAHDPRRGFLLSPPTHLRYMPCKRAYSRAARVTSFLSNGTLLFHPLPLSSDKFSTDDRSSPPNETFDRNLSL